MPERSGSMRFRSPRCCSRRGSPSGGVTKAPQPRAYQRAFDARRPSRVRRPRSVRAGRARLGRVCGRRPPRGRGARAPGARRRGGGTVAVGRGARARRAGARAGRRGRRRHRRAPVQRVLEWSDAATARSTREPVPRARRRPGYGRRTLPPSRRQPSLPPDDGSTARARGSGVAVASRTLATTSKQPKGGPQWLLRSKTGSRS